ncbi:C-X-C motif chemokine 9 [Ictalurus punctatus]|uniref:C-X-C motif chemokine 9 n=1 Tax=Ictalurus punctatus TaxID=7998 RepID=A0A1L2IW33_ICTPU|nr:C-X-C motif chemokine 9 [Ictalurus punctatus]AOR81885.1 chemokine CXCL20.2 [Ictalurus punctatus]ARD08890.1 chemokine (C-C motif) ligand 36, duplicate 12 protein [Ictalurus punctatus]
MNGATLSLVFLIIFGVTLMFCEGRIGGATERCSCQKTKLQKSIMPELVDRIEVFHPSASCSYTDIIITSKRGRKFCLDPNGKQGNVILRQKAQGGKKKKNNNNNKKPN